MRPLTALQAAAQQASSPPPTVADTKSAFLSGFRRPLPGIYSTIIQDILVQQHLFRWNAAYVYNPVMALGLVSMFDQVLEGLPELTPVFDAFVRAMQEDPAQYRRDAARLEEAAGRLASPDTLAPLEDGDEIQRTLAQVATAAKSGRFLYTRFFAVGIFRLLELVGARDAKALGTMALSLGVPRERVNADLLAYKSVLSKLQASKDIMREFIEREKRKTEERMKSKHASILVAARPERAAGEVTEAAA